MTVVIINPNSTASMTEAMVKAAEAAVPNLSFEGWTSEDGPPAIQGRDDGEAAAPALLKLVDEAVETGARGIIIGCFDDTALTEAAARCPCPVVGIGQAAFHYCALRNWRFSVVTTLSVSVPIIEENIAAYGLGGFLGRVRASEVPVLELERAPDAANEAIWSETGAAIAEDDVDAVVLGCAGMVLTVDTIRSRTDKAIIDPVETAARCAAWLANGFN